MSGFGGLTAVHRFTLHALTCHAPCTCAGTTQYTSRDLNPRRDASRTALTRGDDK
jgi:hypothetical protein